ncbi:hypothetical protein QCA50_001761 [Cerrena zonata]|uniref:Uncharacterized protein n=1 Tax=Cerrena zonata TaxID=2478898 RepID=A0AAW0GMZ4_9APHY
MSDTNGTTQNTLPDERTPLILTNHNSSHHIQNAGVPEPWVDTFVTQLRAQDLSNAQSLRAEYSCPESITVATSRTAFTLIVLMLLHEVLSTPKRKDAFGNLGERWTQEERDHERLEIVNKEIMDCWNVFLQTEPSTPEVEHVLWISFPLNQTSQRIRLVDLLASKNVPEELLTHPVVLLSLTRTWKLGPTAREDSPTVFGRVSQRMKSLSTPRVLHLLDWLIRTAVLALLIWYIFSPPTVPLEEDANSPSPGVREILMMVYSFSEICRAKQSSSIAATIVFVSLASRLPSVPLPSDIAFSGLLIALTLYALQLHVPAHPSPVFLLPVEEILPLSTLVQHGMSRIFLPVTTFFLPSILMFLFLLSMSMSGGLPTIPFLAEYSGASPLETRSAFVFIMVVLLGIMIFSLIMLILVYPFHSPTNSLSTWDQYSVPIGLDARRAFVRVVIAYSGRKTFPPPLNLLYLLIAALKAVFRVVGVVRPLVWFDKLQDLLWNVLVLPLALVVSGFFCWGLLV